MSLFSIPDWACADYYGSFVDLEKAKLACTLDDDCIYLVDEGCDQLGPFRICSKQLIIGLQQGTLCKEANSKKIGIVNI